MTDREKLVELIGQVQYLGGLELALADHLIANGVTFAKDTNVHSWIPVTERMPHQFVSVLACIPCEHPLPMVKEAYFADGCWATRMAIFSDKDVSHWMPLPEPPKEDTVKP